jgi:predicted phosphodiesterase
MHSPTIYCAILLFALLYTPISAYFMKPHEWCTPKLTAYRETDMFFDECDARARAVPAYVTESGGGDSEGLHIQIASDLHLEFYADDAWPRDVIVARAPVLALLGDIGIPTRSHYRDFLLYQAAQFELVILLAGNHEYYQFKSSPVRMNFDEVRTQIRDIAKQIPNVIFVNNGALIINGVRIIGSTLWAHISDEQHDAATAKMNDYSRILRDGRAITSHDTNSWFNDAVWFISQQIMYSTGLTEKNAVVLTHHAPSLEGTSEPCDAESGDGLGYASPLDYMFRDAKDRLNYSNVAVWCFGHTHTHYYVNTTRNGTRFLSNPMGYPGSIVKEYDRSMTFYVSNK